MERGPTPGRGVHPGPAVQGIPKPLPCGVWGPDPRNRGKPNTSILGDTFPLAVPIEVPEAYEFFRLRRVLPFLEKRIRAGQVPAIPIVGFGSRAHEQSLWRHRVHGEFEARSEFAGLTVRADKCARTFARDHTCPLVAKFHPIKSARKRFDRDRPEGEFRHHRFGAIPKIECEHAMVKFQADSGVGLARDL